MPENFAKVALLKKQYTDQYVEADASVPELVRFAGKAGRVVTVNENVDALVDFGDGAWYDISIKHLKIVAKPVPKEAPAAKAPPAKPAETKPAEAKPAAAKAEAAPAKA